MSTALFPTLQIGPDPGGPSLGGDMGPPVGPQACVVDARGRVSLSGRLHAGGVVAEAVGLAEYRWHWNTGVVVAHPVPATDPADVRERFDRVVLPFLLPLRGVQCMHASGVHAGRGVAALCGESGVGKSTLAAGLARAGRPLWTDDALAFVVHDGRRVETLAMPSTSRLDPTARHLVASIRARAVGPAPAGWAQPLSAVIVLERREGEPVDLELLTPFTAFTSVFDHAHCLTLDDPATRRRLIHDYVDLAALVPVLKLRFASDARRFADVIDVVCSYLHGLADDAAAAGAG